MKTYLVTGAAGFIGSNLVKQLLELGNCTVIGLDNYDNFYDRSIKEQNLLEFADDKNFILIEGDIRDRILLENLFSVYDIELIFHLAAKAGVRPSIQQPNEYYDVNIVGTQNILDMMVKYKIKNLIFASSSSVYGGNKKVPFCESDSVNFPISPYAATKRAGELICYVAHHLYGINISCVRFFTVYGPKQRPEMAIHKFTELIAKEQPLPAFGDGNSERDYTYVEDIVHGLINISNTNFKYDIVNLGESETTKLKDLIGYIEVALGKKANVNWLPFQPGDVDITFADISHAQKTYHYQPTTKVKEGVKKFVAWYLKCKIK